MNIRLLKKLAILWSMAALGALCAAQDLRLPASATAGEELSISTSGSGKATFYLVGPGVSQKREIALGEQVRLNATDMQTAGHYTAIICSDSCHGSDFLRERRETIQLDFSGSSLTCSGSAR